MEITTVSSKGQIVLPKSIRNKQKWKVGMRLCIIETDEGLLLKPNVFGDHTKPEDVAGSTGYKGKAISITEMDKNLKNFIKKKNDSN